MEAVGDDFVQSANEESLGKAKEALTTKEVGIVEATWKKAAGLGVEKVGVLLFHNIFKLAPEALQLYSFRNETNALTEATPGLKAHGVKVVTMVGTAVDNLRDFSAVVPALQELGIRHIGYSVVAAHYIVVGKALMQTLENALGADFTPEARIAWSKVWQTVSTTMIEAAASGPTTQAPAPLTPAEIRLVRQSWSTALSLGSGPVGLIMYRNLFGLSPDARKLFSFGEDPDYLSGSKLKGHATRVVTVVGDSVAKLDNLPALVPELKELGLKHVGYNVKPAHYDLVGKALLMTLKVGLGPELYTKEVEAAWIKTFDLMTKTMMHAAK